VRTKVLVLKIITHPLGVPFPVLVLLGVSPTVLNFPLPPP